MKNVPRVWTGKRNWRLGEGREAVYKNNIGKIRNTKHEAPNKFKISMFKTKKKMFVVFILAEEANNESRRYD